MLSHHATPPFGGEILKKGSVVKQTHRGLTWQAAFTIAFVIVVILYIVGSAKGATTTSGLTVTPSVMGTAMRAIHYPVAKPRTLRCKGLGVPVNGRYATFRCAATWKHHHRAFLVQEVAVGGWMCVGRQPGCKLLGHGFYPGYLASPGWQEVAVNGWLTARQDPAAGSASCTGTSSPLTCATSTGTVTLTYTKARGGYVETVKPD